MRTANHVGKNSFNVSITSRAKRINLSGPAALRGWKWMALLSTKLSRTSYNRYHPSWVIKYQEKCHTKGEVSRTPLFTEYDRQQQKKPLGVENISEYVFFRPGVTLDWGGGEIYSTVINIRDDFWRPGLSLDTAHKRISRLQYISQKAFLIITECWETYTGICRVKARLPQCAIIWLFWRVTEKPPVG